MEGLWSWHDAETALDAQTLSPLAYPTTGYSSFVSDPVRGHLAPFPDVLSSTRSCLPEDLRGCDLNATTPTACEASATSAWLPLSMTFVLIPLDYLKVLSNCLPDHLLTLGFKNNRLSLLFSCSFSFTGKLGRKCREFPQCQPPVPLASPPGWWSQPGTGGPFPHTSA